MEAPLKSVQNSHRKPLSTSTASPSTRRGTPSSAVRGRIIAVQSGREAEAEILGPPFASDDDDDDHRVAEALAEDLGLEPEAEPAALARLRRAACQLVRRHRADIETIARMLMERGTLPGEEIDAALPPGFMARPVTWSLALAEVEEATP
ncbi:hypothetical protein [Methylobacterium frigidaeris]|uniref:Peptidase M41 domain-containing protein n=1 Tax=Methylobacterium frigidaeris TaxID=2038277 RepID=A0AA37HI33_9HYPH|nr:hypothetical protein [Methylobacterium frigidaeris]GJD66286.1 hypothetical protein MPEAHAMD_6483 [Methylobacterium frigidaeris]